MRLIGPDGDQLGIVPTDQALERAREHGLALLGTIPEDGKLREMDQAGQSLLDLPAESDAMRGIREVLTRLGLT